MKYLATPQQALATHKHRGITTKETISSTYWQHARMMTGHYQKEPAEGEKCRWHFSRPQARLATATELR
jgi:hypothetical protein